jgi:heme oxygenase
MPEKSPNQLAIQLRSESLQRAVQTDDTLTAFQKGKLTRQAFRMKFEERQQQFRASLEVSKYQLDAQVNLIKSKIDIEKDSVALGIRQDYLNTLADVGMRVELSQLDFLTEFGTRLKSFRRGLEKKDIEPDEKERIMQMSRDAFDRIYRRLMELMDRMLPLNREGQPA